MKEVLLSAKNVCKSFANDSNTADILHNINLDIYKGDFTIIMGSSGAGKSTLLYILSGMDSLSSGKVFYKKQEISSLHENKMAALRIHAFGFVFQQTHLVSNLSLFENVAVAGYISKNKSEKEVNEKTKQLLKQMNVEKAENRLPAQTSGGEAQRAAIARALINNPEIIFADEPTGALNKRNTDKVLNLLTELNQNGQSILMVTHDLKTAIYGTRILYLDDGKILSELNLPSFYVTDIKERELKIHQWLSSLQW